MIKLTKKLVKKAFHLVGLDITKRSKIPEYSLLGIRNLPIKTIIDIGANTGQFAKKMVKIFPQAKLFCFEPLPNAFKQLSQWANVKKGKVSPINCALSDKEEKLVMFSHVEHSPSSSFLKTTSLCEKYYPQTKKQISTDVQLTTLDKWANELQKPLEPEILVKMDVQGYEDRVIRGGKETLSKAKACLLEVSLDTLYENQANFKDITSLLNDLGYSYVGNLDQTYAADGHVIYLDAVFFKDQHE